MLSLPVLKVVIPTFESARYIDIILAYYRDHAVQVDVYVDTKSTDMTRTIAATFGTVRDLHNEARYIEPAIATISRAAGADWILRLDDDELPSLAMMQFVDAALVSPDFAEVDVVGFARHQCLVTSDGRLFECPGHGAARSHRQFRLYRPDRVAYLPYLHTPGFDLRHLRVREAPADACMIHLDWAVHTYAERQKKRDGYESIVPGHWANAAAYYLYEIPDGANAHLVRFEVPEFAPVARHLAARGHAAPPELFVE